MTDNFPDADLLLARRVAEMTATVPGVHSLGNGVLAEAATYSTNGKVVGVVVEERSVEIHVIASEPLERPLFKLADSIRERVSTVISSRSIDVVVEDLAEPEPQSLKPGVERQSASEGSDGQGQ